MFAISEYVRWHYGYALKKIYMIGVNYVLFFLHFFSITLLIKTLFRPWRKDYAFYDSGFDIQKMAQSFMWNIISRFLGAIVRSVTIMIGMTFLFLDVFVTFLFLVFWVMWPVLLLTGIFVLLGIIDLSLFI